VGGGLVWTGTGAGAPDALPGVEAAAGEDTSILLIIVFETFGSFGCQVDEGCVGVTCLLVDMVCVGGGGGGDGGCEGGSPSMKSHCT